jgi:acetolactate synthase I/II/III large subunit
VNVGEATALALIDEGVDAVFSLLGDGTMRIVTHLAGHGVPVFEGRHEAYVYAMADGYARASGRPAVCAITGGPALGHTFTAMTAAVRSRAPVVLLTGPASRDDLHGRQRLDHRAMTELTGAGYFPVHGQAATVRRVRDLMDWVRTQRLPAVLDVPEVVQADEFSGDLGSRSAPSTDDDRPRIRPDPRIIEAAARLIARAERPVVLAGAGAVESGAVHELRALGDRIGALMATTIEARGLFWNDPFDAGVAGGYASRPAAELFRSTDLVISFGASMDKFTTLDGDLFPLARFVQVDIRPPGPMTNGRWADLPVQGDATTVATELLAACGADERTGFRSAETARTLEGPVDPFTVEIEPDRIDPRQLCARLDALLPESCGWTTGNSGHFWAFPIMHMRRWRKPMLHASGFGAIGYGIPVGLGAALAAARPVVVFEGDGGAMMHIQAIETAARYSIPVLVVVMDDGALGAEFHSMIAEGLDPGLSLTPPLDLAAVARALGARSATITGLDGLEGLVTEFLDSPGPMVVHAMVSRRVISAPMRRTTYGWPD